MANDGTQGYAVGSIWVNTSTQAAYIATSVATGAAAWKQIDNVGAGSDTLATVTARGNTTSTGISLTENGNLASSYALNLKRNTDSGPLGYLIQAQNAAASANLYTVDVNGNTTGGTYNGLTLTSAATGFTIAGGTVSKTLTLSNTLTLSGTDGSTLNIGTGGTLGTAAYTAASAYAPAFTSGTANYFWATPNGSAGVPSLRAIVAADIPTLNQSTTGNAATATNLTGLTATVANLNTVTGGLGTAAFTASSAYATSAQGTLATNALPSASFTDAAVTGKLITGYVSGAGVVAATDTLLQAIQKLNGNIAANGNGTVTSVSTAAANNGVTATWSMASPTPALTIGLAAITPTSVNGLTLASAANGFTIAGGTVSKTLTLSNTLTLSGTDGSTLNIGTGGTLGTAAYTAASAYAPAFTSGTANYFWATPNGSAGVPSLRAIVAADIPTLNQSTTGNAATATNLTGLTATVANLNTVTGGLGTAAFTASSAYATSAQGTLATNALPSASFTDAAVTGKLITGYVSGAGVVAATDTLLQAIQKLNGNTATKQDLLTNSAGLAAALSDETGTGLAVFSTNPILTTPTLGAASATSITLNAGGSYTGVGAVILASAAASNLTINSGTTGTLAIGDDASSETINLGTGGAVKTLFIGSTNTTSITNIQSGSGGINLQANGTATGNVQIGDGGAASATPDMLVLDTGSAEPAGTNGAMYYSTALNKLRCYENGAWKNCVTTSDAQMTKANLTNASTTPANTSVLLGTYNITPASATGDVYVYASVFTNSTSSTNQTITAEIHSGTTCAGALLDSSTATLTAATGNDGPTLFISTLVVDPGASVQNYAICARSTTNNGVIAGGKGVAMVIDGGADVAEVYSTNDTSIEAGDVVAYDPTITEAGMKKSSGSYDNQVFGVITTNPGLVIGDVDKVAAKALPVALAGRIPVKVNLENGPIKTGDYLTSSSTPGVAMKATKSGPVIGQAMSSFAGSNGDSGKVLAFVKNTYFNGAKLVDGNGSDLTGTALLQKLLGDMNNNPDTKSSSEIVTDRVVAGQEVVTPQVITDTLIAKNIKAEHIEGLEFIQTGIQDAQDATKNNAGDVKNLGAEVSDLKNTIAALSNKSAGLEIGDLKNLESDGGLVVGGRAEFKGLTFFQSVAEFFDKVIFHKSVEFAGETIFNKDTAGYAVIGDGQDTVKIDFENAYSNPPVVNASISLQQIKDDDVRKATEELLLTSDVKYIITNVTEKSFEIKIGQKAIGDIPFAWQAIAVKDAKTTQTKVSESEKDKTLETKIDNKDAVPVDASTQSEQVAGAQTSVSTDKNDVQAPIDSNENDMTKTGTQSATTDRNITDAPTAPDASAFSGLTVNPTN